MNINTQVVVLTDAIVAKGQKAWSKIKATAAEQRELWRQVGEALLVGRRQNPSNQGFSKWCKEMGFDMDARVRSDAMWFASHSTVFQRLEHDLTHPTRIRQWFNDQPKDPLPEDLASLTVEIKTIPSVDQKTAEKVAKLVNRATAGDEGSEIAKRHLDAVAKKHGVSTDELKVEAAAKAPYTYFQFTPAQVDSLTEFKQDLISAYRDMLSEGLTKEAIIAIYMNVINEIKEN